VDFKGVDVEGVDVENEDVGSVGESEHTSSPLACHVGSIRRRPVR
jgi:hypothetical protein